MPEQSDDDVLAIAPTRSVKVAAAGTILSGVLSLVVALQAGALLQASGVYRLSEPVFGLLGLGSVVFGYRLSRMRGEAALAAAVLGALSVLAALSWFALLLVNGVFLLLALMLTPVASLACIASFASIKATKRADEARSRLRAQGFDAGI